MADTTNNKSREDGYEDACYICHRLESSAGPMIRIPGNICICHDCMQKTFDSMGSLGLQQMIPPGGFYPTGGTAGTDTSAASKEEPEEEEAEVDLEALLAEPGEEEEPYLLTHGGKYEEDEEAEKGDDAAAGNPFSFAGLPNIGMIGFGDFANLTSLFGDLGGMMPPPQRVKQKKKAKKEIPEDAIIDIAHIPPPHEIKGKLDDYVVGQEKAKKVMSVAVYNHYKRVFSAENLLEDDVEIEKSNILMVGPTGSGKTYMVRTLARLLDVPLAITDATSLTEAGYIGDDIESVVSKLLAAADNDVERAEKGIIFIDEIDKLAKKRSTNQRDVSGESVQQGLLKLLEGAEVEVPVGASSKNAMVPMAVVDTSNILFICGGAFPDLTDVIKERLTSSSSMGFVGELKDKYDEDKNLLSQTNSEDLRKFGMIPEFIGRMPIIVALEALDEDALIAVLTEPKNAITKQYRKLLNYDEVDLEFEEDALRAIAKKAVEKKLGARGLRSIIEDFMMDIMYEIPKDDNIGTVIVTEDYVEGHGGPKIQMRTDVPARIGVAAG